MSKHAHISEKYKSLTLDQIEKKLRASIKSKARKFANKAHFIQEAMMQGADRHSLMILDMLLRGCSTEHISNTLLFPIPSLTNKYRVLLSFLDCFRTKQFIDHIKEILGDKSS